MSNPIIVMNMNLGNLLDVKEVSEALISMKNNKTPGIDGIPADFLKVFWRQLKFLSQMQLTCATRRMFDLQP